ncbi:imidazole glycerol phosphate synthase, glutamine amidotransferase subunit [Pseudopedobacter saltans DSM 12145]|uniref:Imidazole glycerol phosphate synthase subunit HisH n=1 Tax=Pseudopedobacter saltans (strain ATCC 51119 / DSM 12145 / JCM 21818 / CCUG 39354 / LMG 10337 / NBRC 100064 / NCIMB 13643) TaxID=762903 RepID=F0S7L4_PSESL|nr:imidazole glycerol phosphate synthase subunit HisH [Pseudopedobacter saltans]ADY52274.1 imidazole glycerol phosphate synthase, glutamine amidotransferase subunit [Pseudopedobacter saltans DSM 12145]
MIGIVNYGAGNIFSLTSALERLGLSYGMINTEADFDKYEKIIIPGVGHAGTAMQKLKETGLVPAIKALTKPVLGICVGMQLLTNFSEEGNSDLLGIIPLKTLRFKEEVSKKVPHMGWNQIKPINDSPIFTGIADKTYFYFVHSYFIEFNTKFTAAICEYGIDFSAAIQKDNFYAVQFHPEKSGEAGERLLKNFANL